MRFVLSFVLALWAQLASAQVASAPWCLPASPWVPIELSGGQLMQGIVPPIKGEWHAVWCRTGTFNGGTGEVWRLKTHAVLDKYRTVNGAALVAAARSILEAPDPLGALDAMLTAGRIVPPVGSQDRFEWETLLYAACQQGTALPPLPGATVTGTCTPPTPISPPVETWRTPAAGTFTIYTLKNGALGGIIAGRKATANAACDCASGKATSGTSTYCSLSGGPAAEVTLCKKAAP